MEQKKLLEEWCKQEIDYEFHYLYNYPKEDGIQFQKKTMYENGVLVGYFQEFYEDSNIKVYSNDGFEYNLKEFVEYYGGSIVEKYVIKKYYCNPLLYLWKSIEKDVLEWSGNSKFNKDLIVDYIFL